MGYELSSFNMKSEMEEGKFDEDGTFHRSFDPHAVHDRWMENIDEREMRKARRFHTHAAREHGHLFAGLGSSLLTGPHFQRPPLARNTNIVGLLLHSCLLWASI